MVDAIYCIKESALFRGDGKEYDAIVTAERWAGTEVIADDPGYGPFTMIEMPWVDGNAVKKMAVQYLALLEERRRLQGIIYALADPLAHYEGSTVPQVIREAEAQVAAEDD